MAMDLSEVDKLIGQGIAERVFPGACYAVGLRGDVAIRAHGRFMYTDDSPAVREDSIWDLASLTKVVGATTAAMILFDEGKLKLDQRIVEFLPQFGVEGKESITVRNMLLHNSGLAGGANIHKDDPGWSAEQVIESIYAVKPKHPVGVETIYSDLSMVVLGKVIEKIIGEGMDELLARRVYRPLGMNTTFYRPAVSMRARCAPVEKVEPWRARVREERGMRFDPPGLKCSSDDLYYTQGDVHDPTAFMIGGVSGNAGLFSTAGDLAKFCAMMLRAFKAGPDGVIRSRTIQDWTRRQSVSDLGSTRGFGWDTKSPEKSSGGRYLSMRAFGHTGYTGTSIWIDPHHDLFIVLLSNRVHPVADSGDVTRIGKFRPEFHDCVARACGLQPMAK